MASTDVNTLELLISLLIFIILIIVYYYLLKLEDEKTCNCINTNLLKFCHNFIKFTFAFFIIIAIVFSVQYVFKLENPKFIKEIFVVISILLFIYYICIYIAYIVLLNRSKCSCIVNNPLLNKIFYVSCLIPIFLSMLLLGSSVSRNQNISDHEHIIMFGGASSIVVYFVLLGIEAYKQPKGMWDPVLGKWRYYIWDDTLNKYVYIDDPEATISN